MTHNIPKTSERALFVEKCCNPRLSVLHKDSNMLENKEDLYGALYDALVTLGGDTIPVTNVIWSKDIHVGKHLIARVLDGFHLRVNDDPSSKVRSSVSFTPEEGGGLHYSSFPKETAENRATGILALYMHSNLHLSRQSLPLLPKAAKVEAQRFVYR